MLIDLIQLRTFVAVAEERHLTHAAERLHISRSSASTHIRAIEQRLDMQLFVRTNRNLSLTRAGELLLQEAKPLINQSVRFAAFARELRGKIDGTLVLGANSEPQSSRVGEIVAVIRERHPLVCVDMCARHSGGTLQGLKTGEIDAGLVSGEPRDPSFTYYPLTRLRFRIAGPHAWKERIEQAGWEELAAMPWVTSSDDTLTYSSWLRSQFADKGLTLNAVVRFDNGTLARTLPATGVGLMLLREEYALQGERDGTLALSPLGLAEFSLQAVHLTSRVNDPLVKAFVEAVAVVWPKAQARHL
jgi:DNA-binding transcriptional LysR family regulator